MKKEKIIYWATTGIFSVFMALTGLAYFTDPQFTGIFKHMGFPNYFRVEIGLAKLIGAALLLFPKLPARIKEWTYAGFAIMILSGAIAHIESNDPAGRTLNAVLFFIILVLSYIYWNKTLKGNFKAGIPA